MNRFPYFQFPTPWRSLTVIRPVLIHFINQIIFQLYKTYHMKWYFFIWRKNIPDQNDRWICFFNSLNFTNPFARIITIYPNKFYNRKLLICTAPTNDRVFTKIRWKRISILINDIIPKELTFMHVISISIFHLVYNCCRYYNWFLYHLNFYNLIF